MNGFGLTFLFTAILGGMMFIDASSQPMASAPDSTTFNYASPYLYQLPNSAGGIVSNQSTYSMLSRTHNNCLSETMPAARIKIFVPDHSLTESMPIIKPAPVDQKIFIPGCGSFKYNSPDSLKFGN